MRVLTLLCALAVSASPLRADAIYDVGSNTTFATFQAALAQALADHPGPLAVTVRARALASSVAPISLDYGSLPFQPQPGFRLVLEAGPGVQAVVSGSGSYGIFVSGVANVSIEGLTVQGFNVAGLRLVSAANAQVRNCVISGGGTGAIDAEGAGSLLVDGCSLAPTAGTAVLLKNGASSTLRNNSVPTSSGANYGYVLQNSDGSVLDRNRADGADYPFNVFSSRGVTVNANVAIGRGKKRGLVLDNAAQAVVARNLLVGQDVGVELQSSTGCALVQNTVWEHGTAALYAHNNSQPLSVRNNLWNGFLAYFLDGATQAGLGSDNNGFRYTAQLGVGSGSYTDLATWKAAGQDAGSIESDPLFVTLSGTEPYHFKLQSGSTVQGYGADLSALIGTDYFGNYLFGSPSPWDPGFHVVSVSQNTPTVTPTSTPVLPTATPTATATPTVSPTFTPSPIGTATVTPSATLTATITPTYTLTPYPFQRDRVLSYPNPWSPNGAPLNIVYEPDSSAGVRIFDMSGELVLELPASAIQAALGHAVWDGRDRDGRLVPSGLYVFVVSTPKGSKFARFTVLY